MVKFCVLVEYKVKRRNTFKVMLIPVLQPINQSDVKIVCIYHYANQILGYASMSLL